MSNVSATPHYSDYTIKWATLDWEIEQAFALRRKVFCQEQGIFAKDDRDDIDDHAQVLVAIANQGGWHDQIAGTVRIHKTGENTWCGSRLAVASQFRRQGGLGPTLIKLAVSSAHALGCKQFLAQVQKQNERMFQRLNWRSDSEIIIKDRLHVMMEADLEKFPPYFQTTSGFVIRARGRAPAYKKDLAPQLLNMPFAQINTQNQKMATHAA